MTSKEQETRKKLVEKLTLHRDMYVAQHGLLISSLEVLMANTKQDFYTNLLCGTISAIVAFYPPSGSVWGSVILLIASGLFFTTALRKNGSYKIYAGGIAALKHEPVKHIDDCITSLEDIGQ